MVRLPVYQRILTELLRGGVTTVSSEQLASLARVNAAKVRKDLSLLGSFGTRGTGYDTAFLVAQIDRALGVDRDWPVAIVGIGNLGRALVNSEGFSSRGLPGRRRSSTSTRRWWASRSGRWSVRHLDELGRPGRPRTARPSGWWPRPAAAAQEVADALVAVGVALDPQLRPAGPQVPAGRPAPLRRPVHRAPGHELLPVPPAGRAPAERLARCSGRWA